MKTLKGRRRGGGLLNYLSGRKAIRQQGMMSRTLNEQEQAELRQLQSKWIKTRKNKNRIASLTTRIAPPEAQFQAQQEQALAARSRFAKFFNRFYKQQNKPTPKEQLEVPIEGVSTLPGNIRPSPTKEKQRAPNRSLPVVPYIPAPEFRMINGRRVQLSSQIQMEGLNIPLLYGMWRQVDPPTSVEQISDEEFAAFAEEVKRRFDEDQSIDQIAREMFHVDGGEAAIQEWVVEHEQGPGYNQGEYRTVQLPVRMPDRSRRQIEFVKVPGAVSFPRYLSRIAGGKKALLLALEHNDQQCTEVGQPPAPLSSLKSNECFTIINPQRFDPSVFPTDMLGNNWMFLAPSYMPIATAPFLSLAAKYFGTASYIQEALDAWAIEGMDALFLELLQTKYPEYALKFTTYVMNTADFPYQKKKLRAFENFVLVDKSLWSEEIGFTALNPFKAPSTFAPVVHSASEQEKLYAYSPYMGYAMKIHALDDWKQAFPSPTQEDFLEVYMDLTPQEKITVEYLQYLLWQDRFSATTLNPVAARDAYKAYPGDPDVMRKLIDLFFLYPAKQKAELVFYQKCVTKTYKGDIFQEAVRKRDLEVLLQKFMRAAIPQPPPVEQPLSNARLNLSALGAEAVFENEPEPLPRRVVWGNNRSPVPPASGQRAPATGAFAQAAQRRAPNATGLERRRQEVEAYLAAAKQTYASLAARSAEIEARETFLQRKKRYGTLTAAEQRTLRNAAILRAFPDLQRRAEEELQRIRAQLGYPPLPASNTEQGNTNSNTNSNW